MPRYLIERTFNEGLQNGEWKYYDKNGQLVNIGNFVNGKQNGKCEDYFNNEQLSAVNIWDMGKLMNVVSCFDGRGNNLEKGTLKDGNGTVKRYNFGGKLLEEYEVVDGKRKQ